MYNIVIVYNLSNESPVTGVCLAELKYIDESWRKDNITEQRIKLAAGYSVLLIVIMPMPAVVAVCIFLNFFFCILKLQLP